MDPKKAARKEIVERVNVYKRSDYDEAFSDLVDGGHPEVWIAQVSIKEGMDRSSSRSMFFHSESKATEYVEAHPVGSEFNGRPQEGTESEAVAKMTVRTYVDEGHFPDTRHQFLLSSLPMEQLLEAGIFERKGRVSLLLYDSPLSGRGPIPVLSKIVLDFIGHQHASDLKERFGREWEHVAAWEYCWVKFPHSSLVYISAAHDYAQFVLKDYLTAGYLLRDLEVLILGIEAETVRAAERKKKAGEKGKAASSKARAKRRMALLEAMEAFAKRNPDMIAFGDKEVAKRSLPQCVDADPDLWAQGKNQIDQYLTEIRLGDAGPEAKARYQACFLLKPPRRLR
ncbi:hypothetical protein [Castellaniella sp.]|uniref:hypothetical protein n=1 Tax=Castellaniella sp. TaxID=1955812 RepID=UPI002B00293D|nr:hypothetical protein [Castellaniella sp.]